MAAASASRSQPLVGETAGERPRLQPDQQEQQSLDRVRDEAPDEKALQARRRRDQGAPVPADEQAARDGGEHARAAQRVRRPEGEVRRQQREDDLRLRAPRPVADAQGHPCHRHPPRQFADDDGGEGRERGRDRDAATGHRADGKGEQDERRGVVDQPFPLENDQQPLRQGQPAGDRHRRDGVGRGDNGTEDETDCPVDAEQVVACRRHRRCREDDAADGEEQDRPQVGTEAAPAHPDAGTVEQRRQEQEQDEVGRNRHRVHPGDKADRRTGQHEDDRLRHAEPARAGVGDRRHGQQDGTEGEERKHRGDGGSGGDPGQAAGGLPPEKPGLPRPDRPLADRLAS